MTVDTRKKARKVVIAKGTKYQEINESKTQERVRNKRQKTPMK